MLTDRVLVQIPTQRGRAQVPGRDPHPGHRPGGPAAGLGRGGRGRPARAVDQGRDQVLFNPEDRYEVEVQGEDYLILRERDIHAVASERVVDGTGLYL